MSKTFVLDTNVLIDNPDAVTIFRNGQDNRVLIPYTVILELDRLKKRNDLTHIVSEISKNFESDPSLEVIKIPDKDYSKDSEDKDILEEVLYLKESSKDNPFIVVSNDSLFRVRLKIDGIESQQFLGSKLFKSESQSYTGIVSGDEEKIKNCFYWDGEGKLFFEADEKEMNFEHTPWGIKPRSYHQNCAIHLMLNEGIDVATLQSQAGFGKTYIALACAMQLVLQKPKKFEKIFIFKPMVEIGEKMGFLPGDVDEKMAPYVRGILDLIIKLHSQRSANGLFIDPQAAHLELNPKHIEIMALNFIRGMNLENAVIIIDECQNLTRYQTRALLSRMGENVKCFILGDTNQIDSNYLNSSNNGLNWIVKKFKGASNYGHMVLKGNKSRGPICDLVIKSGL